MLPFPDDAFDIGFSNAVIEHVGSRERLAAFLRELVRVSRRSFLATQNRWFPVELDTRLPLRHWLAARVFQAVLRAIGSNSTRANLKLLTGTELRALLAASSASVTLRYNRLCGLASDTVLVVEKPARATETVVQRGLEARST